jgi:predicted SprT family Zn-dependent metalloprotease
MTENNNRDKYNLFNAYSEVDSFTYEECVLCGKDMTNTKEIFVDTETDNYLCQDCQEKYGIKAVKCAEY